MRLSEHIFTLSWHLWGSYVGGRFARSDQ